MIWQKESPPHLGWLGHGRGHGSPSWQGGGGGHGGAQGRTLGAGGSGGGVTTAGPAHIRVGCVVEGVDSGHQLRVASAPICRRPRHGRVQTSPAHFLYGCKGMVNNSAVGKTLSPLFLDFQEFFNGVLKGQVQGEMRPLFLPTL